MLLLYFTFLVNLFFLTIFSYTQVEKPLSISSNPIIAKIVSNLSTFGTYQKETTGTIFLLILFGLFLHYLFFLFQTKRVNISVIVTLSVLILFFSYPAFLSHDIFSYIFDAKILDHYHTLPWLFAPKNFSEDPLLPFVHWSSSTTRYGPIWLVFSSVLYFVGQDNLLLILILFKLLGIIPFFFNTYILSLILNALKLDKKNLVLFVANPLILLESLVGPHTDMLMTTFVLFSLYFLLVKSQTKSLIAFILSIGVKIVSLPIGLAFVLANIFSVKGKTIVLVFYWLSLAGTIIIIARWSINPWYFTLPITLSTLLYKDRTIRYIAVSLSFAALFRYLPYFYLGFFDPRNKIRAFIFLEMTLPFVIWLLLKLKKDYFQCEDQ